MQIAPPFEFFYNIFLHLPVDDLFKKGLVLNKELRQWLWEDVPFWRQVFKPYIPNDNEWERILDYMYPQYDWCRVWKHIRCVMTTGVYNEWTCNGKRHRDFDLPAIEYADGRKCWYIDGKRHREGDKPAIEYANGRRDWYIHGKRHREGDKPAIERANGTKYWYMDDERHRGENQPAIEYANGRKEWYIDGEYLMANF